METINNNKIRYRFLAFILSFMVAIAPLGNIKKVKAIAGVDDVALFAIGGLLITSLAAAGLISAEYSVTPSQLTDIKSKVQTNLEAIGSNAIDQANKLGEAIKSGAESAKIKALASGAVIYAFLSAIQETLFVKPSFPEPSYTDLSVRYLGSVGGYTLYLTFYSNYPYPPFPAKGWIYNSSYDKYYNPSVTFPSDNYPSDNSWVQCYDSSGNKVFGSNFIGVTDASLYPYYLGDYLIWSLRNLRTMTTEERRIMTSFIGFGNLNTYYSESTEIASAESVTVPTVLPSSVSDNINTWDGTSDLVLAPPLPYDIPEEETLVVDPTYEGADVIDPPIPDNPDEEGSITLPWLATLLGLLGLGQLSGFDEGIKSGLDSLVDNITATAQDVYNGVRDWADTASSTIAQGIEGVRAKLGEIAGVITGGLTLGIESIQSALGSIAETIGHVFDPPSKDIEWDKLKNIQLFNKFPFSIPSDLYYLFGLVAADPVAPSFAFPFDLSFVGGETIDATIDLSQFDEAAAIIRMFEFIAFVIGMLYLTKNLIWK